METYVDVQDGWVSSPLTHECSSLLDTRMLAPPPPMYLWILHLPSGLCVSVTCVLMSLLLPWAPPFPKLVLLYRVDAV